MRRAADISEKLARIGDSRIRRETRLERRHPVECCESVAVSAELDQRVADNAIATRRGWRQRNCLSSEDERLSEAIHEDLTRALELREQGKGDPVVYLVHNRLGEPCPQCGTPIARVDFEEHTIYYCPSCQTGGRLLKDRRLSRLLR